MKRLHLAIVGSGKLAQACAEAIQADDDASLSGVVRREPDSDLPSIFKSVPTVTHVSELGRVDAALICVPTNHVAGTAFELLQHGIPLVECAALHGEAFERHFSEIDRVALHHKIPAVVGAGWDPGVLSLLRGLFALLAPKGHTETMRRPGAGLHHTTVANTTAGVSKALATELRTSAGRAQRYVYVELEEGADFGLVEKAIRGDPQYLGEETLVIPVDSVAALEEEGQGVVMERRGVSGRTAHQLLLLEARYCEAALAGTVMVSASHVLPSCAKGAHSLFDLPLGAMWGQLYRKAREQWI